MPDSQEAEAKRSYPLLQTIGTSGLKSYSGYIREEFLPELQGRRGRETFNEMASNDATCSAVIYAITMLLRSIEWTVQPAENSGDRGQEMADLIEGMLFRDMQHTFPEAIESACSMFIYGFAVQEVVWKKRKGLNLSKPWLSSEFDDGLWGVQKLASRSQRTVERWIFDDDGNLLGFEQFPFNGPAVTVPIRRCLHFRTTSELENPEGHSALRGAYRSYYFLKRLQEIEGVGIERDLAGYPVLKVPTQILSNTSDENAVRARGQYEKFLRDVRRDEQEGVLIPSDRDDSGNPFYEFELLSAGGSRQLAIDASISRYQRDIARSVMADFIFLGSEGGGSLALGKSKIQTFSRAMNAYLTHIAAQFNESLIPMIWNVNGLDHELRPSLRPGDIEPEDLAALGSYLQNLATIGYPLATDGALENILREKAGLPPAPERDGEDFVPYDDPSDYRPQPRRASAVDEDGHENPDDAPDEVDDTEDDEVVTAKGWRMTDILEGYDGR